MPLPRWGKHFLGGRTVTTQASFALRGRNPDVLTCIANLSNDEVFTPPELANRMAELTIPLSMTCSLSKRFG